MSRSDTSASIDPSHRHHFYYYRNNIKRKLDDYAPADDDAEDDHNHVVSSDLVSVRMRKDQSDAVSSISSTNSASSDQSIPPRVSDAQSSPSSEPTLSLQFFVRMFPSASSLVLRANPDDTVQSVHEKIESVTRIPAPLQRFIYQGKSLVREQTLSQCSIEANANLQLVARVKSTENPQAFRVIDEMNYLIFILCRGEPSRTSGKRVKSKLAEFLKMTLHNDGEQAAAHLRIFSVCCSVPSALVELYISPFKGNKECGDESIREFVNSCKKSLPKAKLFAPILLEFCKLLSKRATHNDPLYNLCRSSLGSLVEHIGVGKSSDSNNVIEFEDVFPFLSELAAKLSLELAKMAEIREWNASLDSFPSNVHDFTAFLLTVRAAISNQAGFKVPIAMPFDEVVCSAAGYSKEIKFLHGIFIDLLGKMEHCLHKMEECLGVKSKGQGEHLHLLWSQYLSILRELHGISKLYKGMEELYWIKLRQRKVPVCYLILKYARRNDDNGWILGHKDLTNFEVRRHLALMMLPELKDEYDELHEMLIDRSQLLAESFEYIAHADTEALHGGLFMEFKNEEATGPGVLREWFFLVCQTIFNPQNALFVACPNDRRRFFPNPASKVDPLHLEYFTFSGRVIALALMHKVQVGVVFDRVFFLQLAGLNVCLEDIRDADPFLYHSCKQILEMDPKTVDQDALGLTFVREVEELGSTKLVELLPDGKSIVVNSSNRKAYVDLLIQHCFVTSIADQVANFSRGFTDIIGSSRLQKSFFQSLELEDLDLMLHGSERAISIEDWKLHTEYNGYKETDPEIFWFWKIIGRMSAEQRKVLLFFWTSIKYLPAEGFVGLASRLYIYRSSESCARLPSSHTCFYRLCFPPYPSMAVMQNRLHIITQEHVGCSFGTW